MAVKQRQSVSAKMRNMKHQNTVDSTIVESKAILPTDHQARLMNTFATHTSAVIANGASSAQSTWQPVPEGMSEFMNNLLIDAGVPGVVMRVFWSEDGTNNSGRTEPTLPSNSFAEKTSAQWYPIGGAFYKVNLYNGEASPRTCSANIKFRP